MKTVQVGLLGLGNIGTGTYKTLEMNKEQIEAAAECKIEIILDNVQKLFAATEKNINTSIITIKNPFFNNNSFIV